MTRRSRLANPPGWSRKISNAASSAWLRCWPRRSPGTRVPFSVTVGSVRVCRSRAPVIGSLDALQAPVGFEADLPQGGQTHKTSADVEAAGVVDRGLGSQRPSFLVVAPDGGVLVVHVQARGDPVGEDPGAEPSRSRVRAFAVQPGA